MFDWKVQRKLRQNIWHLMDDSYSVHRYIHSVVQWHDNIYTIQLHTFFLCLNPGDLERWISQLLCSEGFLFTGCNEFSLLCISEGISQASCLVLSDNSTGFVKLVTELGRGLVLLGFPIRTGGDPISARTFLSCRVKLPLCSFRAVLRYFSFSRWCDSSFFLCTWSSLLNDWVTSSHWPVSDTGSFNGWNSTWLWFSSPWGVSLLSFGLRDPCN